MKRCKVHYSSGTVTQFTLHLNLINWRIEIVIFSINKIGTIPKFLRVIKNNVYEKIQLNQGFTSNHY